MNLTNKTIGNYEILEEIGRGGMAVVYRAYQPSLNRYVAIKVLPPQLSLDRQFVERFQREARAAAGLRHPNIVVIHDVGQHEGIYYIVMEYLEGRTLKQLIEQEGPLSPARSARIVEQVASALDYAHQRGFIHRDIKPANIFVGPPALSPASSGGDHVTLADFGIAKAASETEHLTRTGVLVGTPEYMSPEQIEGHAGTSTGVDHRTDLYALGVVLYQMLVGRVPFRGTTPHATLHAIVYEPPPPPRQINPNLPPGIEAVVLKAIAKHPDQRYQDGAELVAALQAALRPPAAIPRARVLAGVPEYSSGGPKHPSGEPGYDSGGPEYSSGGPEYSSGGPEYSSGVVRSPQPIPPPPAIRAPTKPTRRRSPLVWIVVAIVGVLAVLLAVVALLLAGDGDNQATLVPPTTTVLAQAPAITEEATTANLPPTDIPPPPPTDVPPPPPTDTPPPATNTPPPPTDTPLPTDTLPPPTHTPSPPTSMPRAYFGRLAFSSNRDGNPEIYVVDLAHGPDSPSGGNAVRLTTNKANDWLPDWSPDGSRIAFTSHRTGSYDLWVMHADGSGQAALVSTGAWDEYARWASDGQRLSLSTTATTEGVPNSEIFVRQADGGLLRVTHSTAEDQWADWSPDGRIVFTEGFQDDSNWEIYIANGDGSGRTLWLGGATCDVQPAWSPDGSWIAFLRISRDTNGNGRIDFEDAGDVWVGSATGPESPPAGGRPRQLTSGIWAATPAWSPDGQWIAFARFHDTNGNGKTDGQDNVDIVAIPLGGGDLIPLVQGPHRDGDPAWTW